MFDIAIYTDVTAAEAVDGRPGFNFQTLTPGFSGKDQRVALEWMLHRVDDVTGRGQEDDETFCYRPDDARYYLSRGRSLGSTASGRGGNQLTQIAVTSDAEDFGDLVPAQMFWSPEWRLSKEATPASAWDAPPRPPTEVGPHELVRWVTEDATRMQFLPRVLQAFEQRIVHQDRSLIVMVHDDLATIVRWLSIACLLANRAAARSLSFRAMVGESSRAGFDVIGCRPDVARSAGTGTVVLDLLGLRGGPEASSPSVTSTMRLLETLDPERALDIIQQARRWDPVVGERAFPTAATLAGVAVHHELVATDEQVLETLGRLAAAGSGHELEEQLGRVTGVLKSPDPLHLLRTSHALAEGSPNLSADLLALSMEKLDDADSAAAWIREATTHPLLTARGDRTRPRVVEPRLLDLRRLLGDRELPRLLFLASMIGARLDEPQWREVEDRIDEQVMDQPETVVELRGHPCGPQVRERVASALLRRLEAEAQRVDDEEQEVTRVHALAELREGRWRSLLQDLQAEGSPRARELSRWEELASLSDRPDKEAARYLTTTGPSLNGHQWAALAAAPTPGLWQSWIENVGLTDGLVHHLLAEARHAADRPKPDIAELRRWRGVLQSLESRDRRRSPEIQTVLGRIENLIDTKGLRGKLTRFGRSSPDSASSHQEP